MRGRELLLIVTAQDRASRVLRRVAGDVRALGKVQDLQLRRQRLQLQQARTATQRMRAMRELQQIESGTRALNAQRARLNNSLREERLTQQLTKAEKARKSTLGQLANAHKAVKAASGAEQIAQRTRLVESLSHKYGEQAAAVNQLTGRLKSNSIQTQANAARMGEAASRAKIVRSQLAELAQTQLIQTRQQMDLNRAIRAAKWERFGTLSRLMGHFGRVTQLAGLVGGAALGYAANSAAKFNQSIMRVATQTGQVGTGISTIVKNSKYLSDAFLKLASDSTSSFDDINEAGYDLFSTFDQLGDSQRGLAEGVKIMRLFSQASIGGMTDINTVANGVVASLAAFDELPKTGKSVETILNRMFAAVRFGRMNFAEFASVLGTVAPAARAAGQSFDVMAGTIAFLSKPLGINKAAVGFARLSEIFSRQKFLEGLAKAGVTITDAQDRLLPFPQVIERLAKAFPKLAKGGGEINRFFKDMGGTEGTIQARRAFVFLMQQTDEYRRILRKTIGDNNEFRRSVGAMNQTVGVKWAKFLNQVKVLFIQLGEAALPTLVKLLDPIKKLTHWFASLDKETKENIGRFAAWAVAIALVGGTIAAILGGLMAFITAIGAIGGLFKVGAVGLLAFVAAVKIFKGEWKGVGDMVFNSWEGFIAGAILATVALKKVTAAIIMTRTAAMAGGAGSAAVAAGGGGMLPMFFGRVQDQKRSLATMSRFNSMARAGGASKFAATMKTAGVAAALLPGPLKLAALAIAGMGVGALIWRKHTEAAAKASAVAAAELERINKLRLDPLKAAEAVGQFGGDTRSLARSKLDFQDAVANVKRYRAALKGLKGEERAQANRDLQRAILDRADAFDALNASQKAVFKSSTAVTHFFTKQAALVDEISSNKSRIAELTNFIKIFRETPLVAKGQRKDQEKLFDQFGVGSIAEATAEIARLRGQITSLNGDLSLAGVSFQKNLIKSLKSLQAANILPGGGRGALQNVVDFAKQIGRMPTLKEMKAIIKVGAEPDWKQIKKLPDVIAHFMSGQKLKAAKVKVQATINRIRVSRNEGGFLPAVEKLGKQAKRIQANMEINAKTEGAFKAAQLAARAISRKKPKMKVGADDSLARSQVAALLTWVAKQNAAIQVSTTTSGAGSGAGGESGKGNRGDKPHGRGILGRRVNRAAATRSAFSQFIKDSITDAQSQFSGFFSDLEKATPSKMLKNFRHQMGGIINFNNALAKLSARRIPQGFLAQLREMGPEASKFVTKLAGMTDKQLAKYVKAWNKAQAAVRRAARSMKNIIGGLTAASSDGAQRLMDIWQGFRDQLVTIFGSLGQGLIDSEWSFAITPAKVLADMRKQLDAFKAYQATLNGLLGKNLPFELIKQLMELGPAGLPYLQALNGMTKEQLAEYIKMWQEAQKVLDAQAKKMLQAQIKEWKKHGKAIAAGIIAGLISEREGLMKFFRGLFAQLLKEAKKELGIKSPSKAFEEVGTNIMLGLHRGLVLNTGVRTPNIGIQAAGGGGGMTTNINMNVNANSDESLQTTLERTRFRWEHRR